MRNILKEKLARGEKPLGTFVGTGSAAVVECLGCAGLDFVILDNEGQAAVVGGESLVDERQAHFLSGLDQFFGHFHGFFHRSGDAGADAPEQHG